MRISLVIGILLLVLGVSIICTVAVCHGRGDAWPTVVWQTLVRVFVTFPFEMSIGELSVPMLLLFFSRVAIGIALLMAIGTACLLGSFIMISGPKRKEVPYALR